MDSRERLTRIRAFFLKHFTKNVDEENHVLCNWCETMFVPAIIHKTKDCPKCGESDSLVH